MTNISFPVGQQRLSDFIQLIGQPARLQILAVLADNEACVCHLESVLGMRQAAISQHLTLLKKAGLVGNRRVGRHIFYNLRQPDMLVLLQQLGKLAGLNEAALKPPTNPVAGCPCPYCNPSLEPRLICKKPNDKNPSSQR